MLFHRSGPNAGQSRGFAFVTFKSRQDAVSAMASLNGVLLGSKKISVKFAKNACVSVFTCSYITTIGSGCTIILHAVTIGLFSLQDDQDRPKPELGIAALAGAASNSDTRVSKKTVIQSIEAKLKMMESMKAGDDFVVNKLAAHETPVIAQYQTNLHQPPHKSATSFRRRHPYHKKR